MTKEVPGGRQLILIGGGGHALVVHDAALASGATVVGVIDDNPKCNLTIRTRTPLLGGLEELSRVGTKEWIIAFGSIAMRRAALDRMASYVSSTQSTSANIVHPAAHVSLAATLGGDLAKGVFIAPLACVQAYAKVGPHCIINTGAIVEHECDLEENVHVAPNATLGGNVAIGRDTLIGIGATVLPGVKIGRGCTIGAGAVVRRDVRDGQTVVGVPAK